MYIPMTVSLHTASLQHTNGDGEWDHARKAGRRQVIRLLLNELCVVCVCGL